MINEEKWSAGEIRQVDKGRWVQCIKGICCSNCYFYKSDNCSSHCYYEHISGNKHVIFKKLENIGDPVECNGQWFQMVELADKTQGCRQCVFKGYCLEEDLHYCKADAVFVKVEDYKPENKKTMEEKEDKKKTGYMYNTETQVQLLVSDYSDNKITLKNLVSKLKELFSGKDKTSYIPFNIEKAMIGKDVCTRDGRKARILCFDAKGDRPIVALIDQKGVPDDFPYKYHVNGSFYEDNTTSDADLMIVTSVKTGYINLYKDTCVYDSIEEAHNHIVNQDKYIDTIKLSWKE